MSKRAEEERVNQDVVECPRKTLYREECEDGLGIAALCEGAARRILLAKERKRARRKQERTFGNRHCGGEVDDKVWRVLARRQPRRRTSERVRCGTSLLLLRENPSTNDRIAVIHD